MLDTFLPFPTLHPLIVHLPIVLLPLTPLLLLIAWARRSITLEWISTALLAAGTAGAILASRFFHPHTDAMTLLAQEALSLHELWADWTQGLAAAALIVLLFQNITAFKKLRGFLKVAALALSLAAAATVILAGHYGALLTHVHKVTVEKD
jgi:uncharacterized membrane protein